MAGAPRGGVGRRDLAGDQPVEQHAPRGKLLFHGRRGMDLLTDLDVGRHVERPDGRERKASLFPRDIFKLSLNLPQNEPAAR